MGPRYTVNTDEPAWIRDCPGERRKDQNDSEFERYFATGVLNEKVVGRPKIPMVRCLFCDEECLGPAILR